MPNQLNELEYDFLVRRNSYQTRRDNERKSEMKKGERERRTWFKNEKSKLKKNLLKKARKLKAKYKKS